MVGNEINPAVYIPGTWTGAGSCGALTVAPGPNGTACSSTGNTQARRFLSLINPAQGKYFSATDFGFNGISANYEGVLGSIEHRLSDNYTILANYTFGHCHGVIPVTSLGGATIENPAKPERRLRSVLLRCAKYLQRQRGVLQPRSAQRITLCRSF